MVICLCTAQISRRISMYFQVNENKKFKFIHAIFHLSLSLIKMLHYFFLSFH